MAASTISHQDPFTIGSTFTCFRKLPIEIRLKIWKDAVPEGQRIVNLIYDPNQDRYFSFNSTPPPILYACRESREVGLKTYTVAFGTPTYPAHIPFDFERDVVYFDDWLAHSRLNDTDHPGRLEIEKLKLGPMDDTDLQKITKVAINSAFLDHFKSSRRMAKAIGSTVTRISRLTALQELLIVTEDVDPYNTSNIHFFGPDDTILHCHTARVCWLCGGKDRLQKVFRDADELGRKDGKARRIPQVVVWFLMASRGNTRSGIGFYEPGPRATSRPPINAGANLMPSGNDKVPAKLPQAFEPYDYELGDRKDEDFVLGSAEEEEEDDIEDEDGLILPGEVQALVRDERKYRRSAGAYGS